MILRSLLRAAGQARLPPSTQLAALQHQYHHYRIRALSTASSSFNSSNNHATDDTSEGANDVSTTPEEHTCEPRWEHLSPLEMPSVPHLPGSETACATFTVTSVEDGGRLDRFIKRQAPGLPVGLIQKLIRTRRVRVNDCVANNNKWGIRTGDVVRLPGDIKLGFTRGKRQPPIDDVSLSESAEVRSWVIHRDARSVVLNKPAGIPVTPRGPALINPLVLRDEARKHPSKRVRLGSGSGPLGTDNRRCVQDLLSGLGDGHYWVVHRLDTNVSGALVIARDVGAAGLLSEYFKTRLVHKTYWALVEGWFKEKNGNIQIPIDGKRAYTAYNLVQRVDSKYAWVQLQPRTGRKHQLRIHCAEGLGCPIVGDVRYGASALPWQEMHTHTDIADEEDEEAVRLNRLLDGFKTGAGLHLMSRNIEYPILTESSIGALRRKRSQGESLDADRKRRMVSVTAPLPPHMRDTWKRLGLEEKWGDTLLEQK